jgi:hypothetical protein
VLVGRPDPQGARVRHHFEERPDHQAGITGPALCLHRGGLSHHPNHLRRWGDQITECTGNRLIARTAVARKILTLAFYGLRDGEIRCLAKAEAS